jgi:hypothetical protein
LGISRQHEPFLASLFFFDGSKPLLVSPRTQEDSSHVHITNNEHRTIDRLLKVVRAFKFFAQRAPLRFVSGLFLHKATNCPCTQVMQIIAMP